MMNMPGDCAVRALARLVSMESGRPIMTGLLMELQTPMDINGY
jgi:hypothetical protein